MLLSLMRKSALSCSSCCSKLWDCATIDPQGGRSKVFKSQWLRLAGFECRVLESEVEVSKANVTMMDSTPSHADASRVWWHRKLFKSVVASKEKPFYEHSGSV